ncbi:DUF1645 domain-containing protein [Cephalotus follicularis]|uniref:DUF1645 domain-containing protein n=1 Tax=Cephalotus follicularis TaxID=3775 RepID=A0A1Q3BLY2_CEPFO|nr:DUF1645 domain-containing protein [Cephalotus follicularis]
MEVMIPVLSMDFDFNSARSSPYVSAPSTPKRFGEGYLSAPASPKRWADFYSDFDNYCEINDSNGSSAIPFSWELRPGTPKSNLADTENEDDFAFDFRKDLEKASVPAEKLFDNGKIRPGESLFDNGNIPPLKLPPRLQLEEWERSPIPSPRSPRSPKWKGIREAFSPRKKKDMDPFTRNRVEHERGRERASALPSSSSRRATRSLSPLRVSQIPWEEEKQTQQTTNRSSLNSKPNSFLAATTTTKSCPRKWRLKDLFLFRSASEGRASPRGYTSFFKKHQDAKDANVRSTDSSASVSVSRRTHGLHYTVNKAASEDLKKKSFLPYKQGILGLLSFNPSVHAVTNSFGTFGRS